MKEATINPRILVVDDVPEVRTLVEAILTRQGYSVQVAASGSDALAMLRRGLTFDLVLLDIAMPGLDGFATFRELDAFRAVRPFSVAFLTGRKEKDEVKEALSFHPDGYLMKPLDPAMLKRKIREMLQKQFRGKFLPRTQVSFVAELTGTPLKFAFRLTEISELDVRMETGVEFVKGALVTFRSAALTARIGHDAEFAVRVRKVESEATGFYTCEGLFEGLGDAAHEKLRLQLYDEAT